MKASPRARVDTRRNVRAVMLSVNFGKFESAGFWMHVTARAFDTPSTINKREKRM